MQLQHELDTYREHLPELLEEQGRFVVICGDRIIGVFGDYQDALARGYQVCGVGPFLIKKIEAVETVHSIGYPIHA